MLMIQANVLLLEINRRGESLLFWRRAQAGSANGEQESYVGLPVVTGGSFLTSYCVDPLGSKIFIALDRRFPSKKADFDVLEFEGLYEVDMMPLVPRVRCVLTSTDLAGDSVAAIVGVDHNGLGIYCNVGRRDQRSEH